MRAPNKNVALVMAGNKIGLGSLGEGPAGIVPESVTVTATRIRKSFR